MATGPLLETKFYAPRWRAGLVARPRLLERLERGIASRLTLVSAPAGFGKTTLLAEWLAAARHEAPSVAWLSLDRGDDHPSTFWTYLITALQRVRPGVGAAAIALLESPRPPPIETLLSGLLNDLGTTAEDIVLVLDDYHLIESRSIHEGVAFLLEHLPPNLHLVITGRADPALPLARLRGRGEMTELRAADLRFTPDEAAAFLTEAMGLDITGADVARLDARTEGWIAGLQLAALSMQGREDLAGFIGAFSGDDRYIVDYLVEEVLDRQPDHIRQFLLQTSILERLSGPLCDAVTGTSGGKGMLERLERGNLFVVPLDDRREWYRYQHLFADVLHAHLREEQPDAVPVLRRRASAWFEQHRQPSEAIRHALAANDTERAAGLVEMEAEAIVRVHQPHRLAEWLKPIPDDLIRRMPVLSTFYALALQGLAQVEAAESRLRDAERWFGDEGAPGTSTDGAEMLVFDHAGFAVLPSRMALARGYQCIASGDVAGTVAPARQALDLLPPDEHHWRGAASGLLALAYWRTGDLPTADRHHADAVASLERAGDVILAISTSYHSGQRLIARGRLAEARSDYEHALDLAHGYGEAATPGTASVHFGLSELHCEWGDLEAAARHLQVGEAVGNPAGLPRVAYRRCLARARLLSAQGDLGGALAMLEQADASQISGAAPDVRPVQAMRVRLWLAQGRLSDATRWAEESGLSVADELRYTQEYVHITLARVLIAQASGRPGTREWHEVDGLLGRLLEAAEAGGRTGTAIEILVLRAIVAQGLRDLPAALAHLERALTLAEPERYVLTFTDEGEPVRDLLREAVAAGVGGPYARRLLSAFAEQSDPTPRAARQGALAEPLTARELEVLRLIASGMRNQEIADRLVVSLPTVKRHIANVYGKLGVSHRTEAMVRANELAIL